MDREKVIEGLEDIQKHLDTGYSFAICWESDLIRDAIALLKEQEAVEPTWQEGKAFCGSCGLRIPMHRQKKKPYCPSCGKAVKWE